MSDEQGRVKPCLECEELFDFDLSYCPNCGSLAVPVEGGDVPHEQLTPASQGSFDLTLVLATAALAALGVVTLLVTLLVV